MNMVITKKELKTAVIEAIEPFAKAVQADFKKVHSRLDKVDSRLDKVEYEVAEVKTEMREMRKNSSKLFNKLDKFIALYERQQQEILFLGAQVKRLEERIVRLEGQKVNR